MKEEEILVIVIMMIAVGAVTYLLVALNSIVKKTPSWISLPIGIGIVLTLIATGVIS